MILMEKDKKEDRSQGNGSYNDTLLSFFDGHANRLHTWTDASTPPTPTVLEIAKYLKEFEAENPRGIST
jgi:hypothetical protein